MATITEPQEKSKRASTKVEGGPCSCCSKASPTTGTRLPRGWKRHADRIYCDACWHERYVMRAITIPVVRPLGDGIGWPELREALDAAWSQITAAANWMTSEMYARDCKREPGMEKMPKMPKIYLYPDAVERFPDLPSQVVSSLEQAIKRKWAAKRYEVMWTCAASTPNARYPQPFSNPAQACSVEYVHAGKDGGDMVPAVNVVLLRGKRFTLQLRGGGEFARQIADFKLIVQGRAIQSEITLIRQRVSGGSNRSSPGTQRDGGGQRFSTRLMCKIVGWFPRTPKKDRTGTMFVRTDADSFLVALDVKQQKLRVWNCDHVRRWISEHTRRINRLSDDQKAEQRPLAKFQSRREADAWKFRNRIDSCIREAVAQVAGVADRMRFAEVKLDDTDRSYFGARFDWSGFLGRLKTKLDELGIVLTIRSGDASGDVKLKTPDPLAETEGE